MCVCDCGSVKSVESIHLRQGRSTSCGCLRSEQTIARNKRLRTTHGHSRTVAYRQWYGMIDRCHNPNGKDFANYGARGIFVCERWRNFENYFADMWPRPSNKHSIDRIDNDGPYSPENCRWATNIEQSMNRRGAIVVEFGGKVMGLKQASAIAGVSYPTAWCRYKRGLRGDDLFHIATPRS